MKHETGKLCLTEQIPSLINDKEVKDPEVPYFSVDNAHLLYYAHFHLFGILFFFFCIDNAHGAN
jgi:hypothetical protein